MDSKNDVLPGADKTSRGGLLTVRQFCEKHSWPTESAMRAMIFRAEELGLSAAFLRLNRRVLIDSTRFFQILRERNSEPYSGGKTYVKGVCSTK